MNRIAFDLMGYPIYWYGVMFAIGILVGLWTGARRARLVSGVTPEQFLNSIPWILVGTLFGARALFVITYWDEYFANEPWTTIFAFRNGGLIYYGGMICALVAALIYICKNKLPAWLFFDICAPSLAIGHVFGRIGCFINGCCYGHATSSCLGFCYPQWHETHGVPVHPVQLYESTLNLILFGVLEYAFRHRKFDGQIMAFYLIGYGVIRFTTEFFRGDVPKIFLSLSQAQLISIAIAIAGAVIYICLQGRNKKTTVPPVGS